MLNIQRLQTDFAGYYAPNLLKIRDKSAQIKPFTLNTVQTKVNYLLERAMRKSRVFLYILKARQTGISTWAEGRIFHNTHVFANRRNVIIANDFDGSENVYNMSRMFYDNLPLGWQPMTKYTNKRQLVFENKHQVEKLTKPGLRSKIDVFTAGRSTSGRSFTFNCMHLSEFAFFPNGDELITSIVPALPASPGHFALLETTANGTNNFAYDEWKRYKSLFQRYGDDCENIPIFIAWFDDPSYVREFGSTEIRRRFEADMSAEDRKDIMERFGLSLEQMWWRQTQIHAMGGDVEQFMQEYPSTDEEAFLTSGRPIFNLRKLNLATSTCEKATFVGELTSWGELTRNDQGRLTVWHSPKAGRRYVVGIDTVEAGDSNAPTLDEKADRAVICVLDEESLVQCAEWVGRLNPIALAPIVRELCKIYNEAQAVPEGNNSGLALIYELQKDYWNIYRRERFDQNGIKVSDALGWRTDMKTKPMLIETATYLFHQDHCYINSSGLLEEMRVYVADGTSGNAKSGHHDDRVMAWMIALFVACKGRSAFSPELSREAAKVEARPALYKRLSDATDRALVDEDEWEAVYGRRAQGSGKGSWLEY